MNILSLIPQRPPFVMIDRLVASDAVVTKSEFLVSTDNIFVANGRFREPGLLENIAQTAAAGAGAFALSEGRPVEIGYIGTVRDLHIGELPAVHDELITEIRREEAIAGVTVVTGRIWCNGKIAARCEMKIFVQIT